MLRADAFDELADAVQQVAALLLRRQGHRLGDVGIADAQLGHELGDLGRVLAECLAQRLGRHLARRCLDVLDGRQVGRCALLIDAVTGEHAQTQPLRLGGRLLDETCLADARLAGHQDESTAGLAGLLHSAHQPRPVLGTGDERRTVRGRQDAAALGVLPRHLPQPPCGIDALELELAAVFELGARGAEHAAHGIGGVDGCTRGRPTRCAWR